ncbi:MULTISPECIES: GNAT family N-acetyltransferase [Kosmotoga]|uniref:GCN5-related N-acetyltransferase n=1 Tax=Kosmotoga olearia (strain ATCC BAA-1733 / DSM 21960 / TBF 19.5.1) TaxID=521045 RepID=C5CI74_KOSOT|nr:MULTISPECIES: GNAT family N-acetyltransferase [Kosmotoga]ACR80776.1 GCN5-related N-acetyltransferase [Kosmotoga olearia TBF 19.5.1]MDI3523946.1 hypothetical protein [Kosmotoga sp.]
MIERALRILEKNRVQNRSIINFCKDYPIELVEIVGESVAIKGKSDRDWVYISSENLEEFKELLKRISAETCYAVLEDWMLPYVIADREVDWILSCIRLYLPDYVTLPKTTIGVKPLRPEMADYIFENYEYREYTDSDYIRERIEKAGGFGIYDGETLVGWIMTQDDGAIGILNVLPAYRRRGYAKALMISMIQKVRKSGNVPFVQIEESNIPSMNLAKSLGFIEDKNVHWVKFK